MPTNWAWVRNVNGFANDWKDIKASGVKGMMNPAEQPLADFQRAYAAAKAAGLEVGIWDAPRNESAAAFAQRMAGYSNTYRPTLLTLDVEAPGKGYPPGHPLSTDGGRGWQYSADLMKTFRGLAGNQRTAVSMMPMQDDFNYKAYLDAGVTEFMPQAYGGDRAGRPAGVADLFNPLVIRDWLIRNGVPEHMINVTLAPGQSGAGLRDANYYTLDDIWASGNRNQFHWATGESAPSNEKAPPKPPPVSASKAAADPERYKPSGELRDKYNPAAQAYAKKRLAELVAAGIMTAMPEGDLAAAWREASAITYGAGGPRDKVTDQHPVGPPPTAPPPPDPNNRTFEDVLGVAQHPAHSLIPPMGAQHPTTNPFIRSEVPQYVHPFLVPQIIQRAQQYLAATPRPSSPASHPQPTVRPPVVYHPQPTIRPPAPPPSQPLPRPPERYRAE